MKIYLGEGDDIIIQIKTRNKKEGVKSKSLSLCGLDIDEVYAHIKFMFDMFEAGDEEVTIKFRNTKKELEEVNEDEETVE